MLVRAAIGTILLKKKNTSHHFFSLWAEARITNPSQLRTELMRFFEQLR
jgi:hypothetical protein